MKNVGNLQIFKMRDLLIRSATSIRKRKKYTHGGPTDSVQERRMQGGVLIISVYQRACSHV